MTPHARRLRDRIRKGLWTGRHFTHDPWEQALACCWCRRSTDGFYRAHVFDAKTPCAGCGRTTAHHRRHHQLPGEPVLTYHPQCCPTCGGTDGPKVNHWQKRETRP